MNECIPQNNLDCFYNTKWRSSNKIPKNDIVLNNFKIVQNAIDDNMYKFINNVHKSDDPVPNAIIVLRDSFWTRSNNEQIFVQFVNIIQSITGYTNCINVINTMVLNNIPTIFDLTVTPHFKNPDTYVLTINEIPLSLGSKEVYDNYSHHMVKTFIETLQDIHKYISTNWKYIGPKSVFVRNIVMFEFLFSKTSLTNVEAIDPLITSNSDLYADFLDKYDSNGFWAKILEPLVPTSAYISYENANHVMFIKKFISALALESELLARPGIYTDPDNIPIDPDNIPINPDNIPTDPELLTMTKDYLIYALVKKYGLYTNMAQFLNDFITDSLSQKELFVDIFYENFGYYLEKLYESKHSDSVAKSQVTTMFNNLKNYCIDVFQHTSMFQTETKTEAINKLRTLDIIIGKQSHVIDMVHFPDMLHIPNNANSVNNANNINRASSANGNFYHNLMTLHAFYFRKNIELIGKKIERKCISINDTFSFIVNAYYEPITNMIYVPTSIINSIFYDATKDPIYNYGSLGTIIAHEIMHSFDNYGSLFDHAGHLRNWWTPIDHYIFGAELAKVNDHYSSFTINDMVIDLDLTIGENIADIAGIKLSFRTYLSIYMPYVNRHNIDQLSPKDKKYLQKFFESWSHTLRSIDTTESIDYAIKYDVHSPSVLRINAPFSHLDEYYAVFDVKPNHQNYLEPALRTRFLDM